MTRPVCILVCALGGEGGGVLAEWLYGAAVRAGHAAQATSIPGVAQRTGATTYYLEIAPEPLREGAPRAVFGLSPVPGCIDLLVSSELLETVRQAGAGFVSRERTWVVSSTARALTVTEKMALGDGRADAAALAATLQKVSRGVDLLDLNALAREANTAISAVLLGAIAGSGVLPLPRSACEEAIRAAGKGVAPSLAGFALAFDALAKRRAQEREGRALVAALAMPGPSGKPPLAPAQLRALAHRRVAAYLDEAYARLFDERLARLAAAEAAGRGAGAPTPAADEAARWLALWMCFDDIVQVAALKLAASRQARVRREVNAAPADIVRTFDHFKPGVPELAGLLPAALAKRLVAWDRARVAAGREPWALPMKIGTHTLLGALALRLVASLRPLRARGQRFAAEQALIERWLGAVERGAREDAALGLALARCGALVKGYGSTNERGKENLLHIVEHLAFTAGRSAAERAEAVQAARTAASADDAGRALDATLVAQGVPARPPREHTVRWFKRRPAAEAAVAGPRQ
ncbi:MAG: indolepyruvate oxidoreductase subunit beta family protein [Rubrivivax sp.]|nr:indolepyruvate oxidoreductase subunit beta family protein [Rubrivivax sp.]